MTTAKKLKRPSLKTMERWLDAGVARAACIHKCKVEPDGKCPHGKNSWIMELGF